jgi:hypothetical protein
MCILITMETKNLRQIRVCRRGDDEYATISLPKSIFSIWVAKGCTHVQIVYDKFNDQCIISRIEQNRCNNE